MRRNTSKKINAKDKIIDVAKKVLRIESEAVAALADRLDGNFEKAVNLIGERKGRVVVTGMGKSGLVGNKIAATFKIIQAFTGFAFANTLTDRFFEDIPFVGIVTCATLLFL